MGTTFQGWSFYSIVLNYSFFIDSGILNRFKSSHLKSKFPQNQKSTKFLLFGNFLCENVVRQEIYRKTLKICDYVKSVRIQSFFWTVFSSTRTQYGYLLSKSPYRVRIRENTNQRKLCTGRFSRNLWNQFVSTENTDQKPIGNLQYFFVKDSIKIS